jgi:hypothetical protein
MLEAGQPLPGGGERLLQRVACVAVVPQAQRQEAVDERPEGEHDLLEGGRAPELGPADQLRVLEVGRRRLRHAEVGGEVGAGHRLHSRGSAAKSSMRAQL